MTLDASTITRTTPARRVEVDRDRYGRPLVIPPGGGDPIPYTRPSTLAKTLSDGTALAGWKQRMTAYGVARRPDLAALAATSDVDDRARLSEVVAAAMEVAESARGARMGTAIHSATELVDAGADLRTVPEVVRRQVGAYAEVTEKLHPVGVELFCVDDELECAGTTDRLYRLPDGRVIVGDLKTGGKDSPRYAGGEWAIQLAVYAHGARYDPATGARTPLHADLDPSEGVIVHVPSDGSPAALYRVRLDWGREAARLAVRVRAFRRARLIEPFTT